MYPSYEGQFFKIIIWNSERFGKPAENTKIMAAAVGRTSAKKLSQKIDIMGQNIKKMIFPYLCGKFYYRFATLNVTSQRSNHWNSEKFKNHQNHKKANSFNFMYVLHY